MKNELGTTLKGKIFHCAQVKGISLEIAKNRGGCSGKVALPRNRGNPGVIIKSKGGSLKTQKGRVLNLKMNLFKRKSSKSRYKKRHCLCNFEQYLLSYGHLKIQKRAKTPDFLLMSAKFS